MNNTYLQKLTKKINNSPYDYDESLNGLGGWMVFFIIGQFLSLINMISSSFYSVKFLGINEHTDVIFKIALGITPILFILTIVTIYLIFKLNILFRRLYVIGVVTSVLVTVGVSIYGYTYFGVISKEVSYSLGVVIWIIYLYRSKRVRNTFIYPFCQFADDDANKAIVIENRS